MRRNETGKTMRFSFRIGGTILALAAGIAFFGPAPWGCEAAYAAPASQPDGYDDAAWGRLLDDTLEYEEIPDLVEYFNPTYRLAVEQVNSGTEDSYQMAEDMEEEAKEYREMAKSAKKEGDAFYAAQYEAMAKALQEAARNTKRTLNRTAGKLERNQLEPARKTLTSTVQTLYIGYKQLEANQELLEKTAELYSGMLSAAQTQSEIGMATSTDLLSAQVELLSAQNNLTMVNDNLDSLKRTLILLLGWDYTDDPVIGDAPAADVSQIDAISLEADKETAIAWNSTLVTLRDTASDSTHSKERNIEQTKEQIRSRMDSLYYSLLEKRAALSAAQTSFQTAELTWQSSQRMYQLGMLSQLEYIGTEIAYYSAKASLDAANLDMLQALNDYNWALQGVISLS